MRQPPKRCNTKKAAASARVGVVDCVGTVGGMRRFIDRPSISILTRSMSRSTHFVARTAALAGSARTALMVGASFVAEDVECHCLTPGKARPRQPCSAGEAL